MEDGDRALFRRQRRLCFDFVRRETLAHSWAHPAWTAPLADLDHCWDEHPWLASPASLSMMQAIELEPVTISEAAENDVLRGIVSSYLTFRGICRRTELGNLTSSKVGRPGWVCSL